MEPLKITIEMSRLDVIMDHLIRAIRPKVEFNEDLESMRKEARLESLRHLVAACDLLKAELNK